MYIGIPGAFLYASAGVATGALFGVSGKDNVA